MSIEKRKDVLDIDKLNKLPQPLAVVMMGGCECVIDSICVGTGLMKLNISGMIDRAEFIMIRDLVDAYGVKHDPDDFWISNN